MSTRRGIISLRNKLIHNNNRPKKNQLGWRTPESFDRDRHGFLAGLTESLDRCEKYTETFPDEVII